MTAVLLCCYNEFCSFNFRHCSRFWSSTSDCQCQLLDWAPGAFCGLALSRSDSCTSGPSSSCGRGVYIVQGLILNSTHWLHDELPYAFYRVRSTQAVDCPHGSLRVRCPGIQNIINCEMFSASLRSCMEWSTKFCFRFRFVWRLLGSWSNYCVSWLSWTAFPCFLWDRFLFGCSSIL